MPKKFQKENTKAVDARLRKATKEAVEKEKIQKAKEDEYWKEDDKLINRKSQKKEQREQKRIADITRKKENRMLEEEEKTQLCASVSTSAPVKVTQYQLQNKARESLSEEKVAPLSHLDMPLVENLNRDVDENISASGIENAITALSGGEEAPKMSMAAAFRAYKEERMPLLKQKNPKLKFSQLNDLLQKEWQRSPINPLNRR